MEYSYTFLITDASFWIALIIHILSPFSIITLTLFYCCSKKTGKDSRRETLQGPGSVGSTNESGLAAKKSDRIVEEVIKTDRTQEETEMTQELSNEGVQPENLVEISPYPFEMFHRGFGNKKKKKHHHHHHKHAATTGQNDRRSSDRRRTRQQLHLQSPRRQHHIQKLSNDLDSPSQTQTAHARQFPASEVVSKPLSQKEKAEIKDKSQAKPSVDLPVGTDITQSTACSTQPSNILQPDDINANIPSSGDNNNNNNNNDKN